jgi:hypothetical protein
MMLDQYVRLIRMIWNSQQTGDQRENEELLRKTIIASGTRLRLVPWVDETMPLADFEDPNFNPILDGAHELHWFDKRHFLETKSDLDKMQPTESAIQWIRQHAQWIVMRPEHPGVLTTGPDIRELCLQARTHAIAMYLASYKYVAENAGQDPWSWYLTISTHIRWRWMLPVQHGNQLERSSF